MATVEEIIAKFSANTTGLVTGVAKADAATGSLKVTSGATGRALSDVEARANKLGIASTGLGGRLSALSGISTEAGTGILGMSSAATLGVGAVAALAVAVGVKAVHAYDVHHAAIIQLDNALQNNKSLTGASSDAFDKLADSEQHLTGISRDVINSAIAVGARFAGSTDQLKKMVPVAEDLAVKLGVDVPTAMVQMGRAMLGNARALKSLGINTVAFNEHLKTLNTNQEKMAYLLTLVQPKVKGLADAMGQTLGGQMNVLKGSLNDLAIALGSKIVPALTSLATTLNNVVGSLNKVPAWAIATATGFGALNISAKETAPSVKEVGDAAKQAHDGLGPLLATLNQAVPATTAQTTAWNDAASAGRSMAGAAAAAALANVPVATNAWKAQQGILAEGIALNDLAGNFLGIKAAMLGTTQSQQSLNSAIAQFASDKKAHASAATLAGDLLNIQQAQLGTVQSQQSLTASVESFAKAQIKAGTPTDAIIAKILAQAHAAGASKSQTDALVLSVGNLIGADAKVPKAISSEYKAIGLSAVEGGLQHVLDEIAFLNNHHFSAYIDIFTLLHAASTAGTKTVTRAKGGVFMPGYAGGADFLSAGGNMFHAGEGNYATVLGRTGAEIVSNNGVLPLSDQVIGRIGRATAQHMPGAGGGAVYVTVNVAGSVTADRDLAVTIRNELLKMKGSRVSLGLG